LPWVEDGLLSRTRLLNRVESATDKTLPLALANTPVQFRSDLRVLQLRRPLHTSSLCTSSPCMVILLPPVAEPALASALPRRRSLHDRPCQGTTVRDLVALRAGLSRAATLHLRPRTPEPRASLARIALLLTRLKPPCTSLLAPGRSPPLESCSCTHTLTPPASAPCLLQPCRVVPAHPRSSAHFALPRTCCSTRAPASPAFAPALATPESTRCFHCAALQLLFAQRPRTSVVCSPEAVGFAPALGSRAPPARTQLPHTSSPVALARSASARSAAPLALALPPRHAPPAPVRHRAHAIALRC
jgi:hypothetical protein